MKNTFPYEPDETEVLPDLTTEESRKRIESAIRDSETWNDLLNASIPA